METSRLQFILYLTAVFYGPEKTEIRCFVESTGMEDRNIFYVFESELLAISHGKLICST